MPLIARKGEVRFEAELDFLARYKHRPARIGLWAFERLPYGRIIVWYRDGAVGTYVGPSLTELTAWAESVPKWPVPVRHVPALPHSAGQLYSADFQQVPETSPPEAAYEAKRVVRHRQAGSESPVVRVRRVRPGPL